MTSPSPIDPLQSSGVLIVDKPQGMTSHDVISRVRRLFGTRKVGHAGTLDPMATGVLVLGLERGTKFLAHVGAETKTYEATIRLGSATHSDDAEGDAVFVAPEGAVDALDDAALVAAVGKFRGDIMQRPSSVSAIKIDGKRAHQRVREGEEVSIPPRKVTVFSFDVAGIRRLVADGAPVVDVDVRVHCSSGTYIRALARDLGELLGVGGHLVALRRTEVGPFSLAQARTLEQLEHSPSLSLSLDEALTVCYPVVEVSAKEALDLSMGKWLEPRGLKGVHAAVAPNGAAVALVKEQGKRLATVFVARPNTL